MLLRFFLAQPLGSAGRLLLLAMLAFLQERIVQKPDDKIAVIKISLTSERPFSILDRERSFTCQRGYRYGNEREDPLDRHPPVRAAWL